jgi:hypothetical protein
MPEGYGMTIDWARCQSIRRALIKAVCERYDLRPCKGSFTLIWGDTRIGYSRGSLRVEE